MKIVFFGSTDFGLPCLEYIFKENSLSLPLVVTVPDRKSGRNQKLNSSPIKKWAISKGVNVVTPESLSDVEFISILSKVNPDIFIVVAFRILPESVFIIPRYGTVNIHASLLPKYRGAAPIEHALMNNDKITGLSTFIINNKIDTGSVINQLEIRISSEDNFKSLYLKLSDKSPEILSSTISKLLDKNNVVDLIVQDESSATYAPKITSLDRKIDWDQSSIHIHNKIRAFSPKPGAYTFIDNVRISLIKTEIISGNIDKSMDNGEILIDKNDMLVKTDSGLIRIIELQVAGKSAFDAQDFINGYIKNNGNIRFSK